MNRILHPGLIIYSVLSCLGPVIHQVYQSHLLIPYLTGYFILLSIAVYLLLFDNQRPPVYIFIWLGSIGLNIIIHITGGIDSPGRYLYILLVLAAVFQPKKPAYGLTAVIVSMDTANILLWNLSYQQAISALGFDASLALMAAVAVPAYSRLRSHAESNREKYRRLLADARAIDPLESGLNIESLTAQGMELSNVSSAVARDDAFKGLVDIIRDLVPAHTYAVFTADGDGEVYKLRCIMSKSKHTAAVGARPIAIGEGLIGICFSKKMPQYLPDIAISSKSLGYYTQDVPIKSFLFIPVIQGEKAVGALVLDSLEKNGFSLEMQDLLVRFAPFFGQIIEKLRISQELEIRAKIANALHHMSTILNSSLEQSAVLDRLAHEMKKIVPYDSCAFALYEEDGSKINIAAQLGYDGMGAQYTFPVSESAILNQILEQWKLREATGPYDFPEIGSRGGNISLFPLKTLKNDFLSLYCQPLSARSKFIGVFVMSARKPRAFAKHHKDFIATLMNQVAAVIDNTYLHRRVLDMALTDGLTGLLNHRTFMEKLDEEFQRLDRNPRPFSLLILDIDYFKKVNDTYGHPVGDMVLKHVASVIRGLVRSIDFVARYGGEEFAVGMVDADLNQAIGLAERIRKAVANSAVTAGKNVISLTVSIGIASTDRGCRRKEDLIALADEALYEAKRGGRNRVHVSGSSKRGEAYDQSGEGRELVR